MNRAAQVWHPREAHAPTPNFDRLAGLYRWMEYFTFGPWLERCRCAFVADLSTRQRALVIGDGDGRFTAQLLRANSAIEVDAVDASPAMLRALRHRAEPYADRVRTYCADARDWQPAHDSYDLVVTHFFLDCLNDDEIRALAEELRSTVSVSAVWVVSEFAVPEGWFGRLVARPVNWMLYSAFGLLTGLPLRELPDYAASLRAAGFTMERRKTWLNGLIAGEIWCGPAV